jgi:hypothetical protein
MKQVILAVVFVSILTGCATTVPNVESVSDFEGKKLLIGRFVFSVNGEIIEPKYGTVYDDIETRVEKSGTHAEEKKIKTGFTVLLGNGKTKKLMSDQQGYVYIPVDAGHYSISRIVHHSFNDSRHRFRATNSGINVQQSDTVVNFGTINVGVTRSVAATGFLVSAFKLIDPTPSYKSVIQTQDWEASRKYISSKFSISPKSIRSEIIEFTEEFEVPFR